MKVRAPKFQISKARVRDGSNKQETRAGGQLETSGIDGRRSVESASLTPPADLCCQSQLRAALSTMAADANLCSAPGSVIRRSCVIPD